MKITPATSAGSDIDDMSMLLGLPAQGYSNFSASKDLSDAVNRWPAFSDLATALSQQTELARNDDVSDSETDRGANKTVRVLKPIQDVA